MSQQSRTFMVCGAVSSHSCCAGYVNLHNICKELGSPLGSVCSCPGLFNTRIAPPKNGPGQTGRSWKVSCCCSLPCYCMRVTLPC
jgi:hypothetical protein